MTLQKAGVRLCAVWGSGIKNARTGDKTSRVSEILTYFRPGEEVFRN